MVIQEKYKDRFIRSYSDRGMRIRGGEPEGLYDVAIDPEELHRKYVETDIPIEDEEAQSKFD